MQCSMSECLFVARHIYLGITKVHAALIYTRASFIVRGERVASRYLLQVVIYGDNYTRDICDGEQMRQILEGCL